MKIRNAVLVLFIFSFSLHFVFAANPSRFEVGPATSNFYASQLQVQQAANEPNIAVDSPRFSNLGDNPEFIVPTPAPGPKKINTIKTLVPYEDLYKVLQQDIGKYFILPIEEFEELKKVKEAWLASQSKPVVAPPPLLSGIYSLDPLEAPQPLKDRATRPILLAFRQNVRSSNILLKIKRYQDVSQQTVVADRMEVKTNFTTNKSASIMVNMRIRNNNKQYLQLQLASGTEVVSALRNNSQLNWLRAATTAKCRFPLKLVRQSVSRLT